MELYRLSLKQHAVLDGKGGLYTGGRWHTEGKPILYTASNRSLAALERLVHESPKFAPKLVMLTIWLPDDVPMQIYTERELPKGWDQIPESHVSQKMGDDWLEGGEFGIMRVPSAISANEYNYLINPLHADAQKLKIQESRDYYFDQRLQRMIR